MSMVQPRLSRRTSRRRLIRRLARGRLRLRMRSSVPARRQRLQVVLSESHEGLAEVATFNGNGALRSQVAGVSHVGPSEHVRLGKDQLLVTGAVAVVPGVRGGNLLGAMPAWTGCLISRAFSVSVSGRRRLRLFWRLTIVVGNSVDAASARPRATVTAPVQGRGGKELLGVLRAPLPDLGTHAPIRFLPT